jgi:hypothetical protein
MQWHTFNFQGQCMFLLAEQTPNLTCSCIQFTDRYSLTGTHLRSCYASERHYSLHCSVQVCSIDWLVNAD